VELFTTNLVRGRDYLVSNLTTADIVG